MPHTSFSYPIYRTVHPVSNTFLKLLNQYLCSITAFLKDIFIFFKNLVWWFIIPFRMFAGFVFLILVEIAMMLLVVCCFLLMPALLPVLITIQQCTRNSYR